MKINRIQAGIYGTNCYLLEVGNKEAVVIDPGGDYEEIINIIEDKELNLKAILLTHGHGDHIGAVPQLKEKYGVEIYIHRNDLDMIKSCVVNLSSQMPGNNTEFSADILLEDEQILKFGSTEIEVIYTPGHTRGGVCFYSKGVLFSGDTLFQGSIGRTDLYGGDYETLMESIVRKLIELPENTIVYPGHGASTSIKDERIKNPFIKDYLRRL